MASLGVGSRHQNHQHARFPEKHQASPLVSSNEGRKKSKCSQFDSFYGNGKSNIDQYYDPIEVINRGTYGIVYKARDKKTSEVVAMKKELQGLSRTTIREMKILSSLPRHPSIVGLKKVIQDDDDRLFIVMEYLDSDLTRYLETKKKPLTITEVKSTMRQILQGVDFLHHNGIIHRDLKPSNILINSKNQSIKICDFGLSRHLDEKSGNYTPGVMAPWYRAPELLLGSRKYSSAIDIWSVGCIMAELILKDVLFQESSEISQICRINHISNSGDKCNVLRLRLAAAATYSGAPALDACGFDLLRRLLAFHEDERITAKDALSHDWFKK